MSVVEISEEERLRIRRASVARADAFEAATKKISKAAALALMLSPRGQSVMVHFLAIAFCAHERLPDYRKTPSDAADVATIFLSLFANPAYLELVRVFECEVIDRLLKQRGMAPSNPSHLKKTNKLVLRRRRPRRGRLQGRR